MWLHSGCYRRAFSLPFSLFQFHFKLHSERKRHTNTRSCRRNHPAYWYSTLLGKPCWPLLLPLIQIDLLETLSTVVALLSQYTLEVRCFATNEGKVFWLFETLAMGGALDFKGTEVHQGLWLRHPPCGRCLRPADQELQKLTRDEASQSKSADT
ncbi:hypothetical protein B0H19DRAFT_1080234 [Mycena capillaripes]|nr:hypothetical protein B0H19DRAFT_1080234 [Mycena capillaripes]